MRLPWVSLTWARVGFASGRIEPGGLARGELLDPERGRHICRIFTVVVA